MKRTISIFLSVILFISVFAVLPLTAQAASDWSRVRVKLSVGAGLSSLSVTVDGNFVLADASGNTVTTLQRRTYTVRKLSSSTVGVYSGDSLLASGSKLTMVQQAATSGNNVTKIYNSKYNTTISYLGNMEFRMGSTSGANGVIAINELYIEDYLYGVLPFEMSNSWPMEALKAQAVCARLYACKQILSSYTGSVCYDLVDTSADQVYRGYNPSYTQCIAAVNATAKTVMTHNGEPINAYYSASNGGQTESSGNIWTYGAPKGYETVKDDPYDIAGAPSLTESITLPKSVSNQQSNTIVQFKTYAVMPALRNAGYVNMYGSPISVCDDFVLNGVTAAAPVYGYDNTPTKDHRAFPGAVCDHIIAADLTFSVTAYKWGDQGGLEPVILDVTARVYTADMLAVYGLFTSGKNWIAYWLAETADGFTVTRNRWGHGVGLSQYGARYMANQGRSYTQILEFYFPNSALAPTAKIGDKTYNTIGDLTKDPSGNTYNCGTVINCTSFVNLRTGPDSTYALAGTAQKGATFTVIEPYFTASWHKISYDGKECYIYAQYAQLSYVGGVLPAPTATPTSSPSPTPTATVTKTGTVINCTTNVNVRALPASNSALLGTAAKGSVWKVTGENFTAGWHMIDFNGQTGFVSASYLAVAASSVTPAPTATPTPTPTPTATPTPTPAVTPTPVASITKTGTVINCTTGVNVRSLPSSLSALLGTAAKGSVWKVTGENFTTGWHMIEFNGQTGFISSSYLSISTAVTTPSPTATVTPSPTATSETYKTGTVINCTTSVNVRASASARSARLGTAAKGSVWTVKAEGGAVGWHAIDYNGRTGFIAASYLQVTASGVTPSPTGTATPAPTAESGAAGVVNATTLNVRSGPGTSFSKLATLTRGMAVTITVSNYVAGWHQINYNGTAGYVSSSYIKVTGGTQTAYIGTVTAGSVNVRAGAGTSYMVLGKAARGTTLTVTKKFATAGWHQVIYNGLTSYISAQYLSVTESGAVSSPTPAPTATADASLRGKVVSTTLNVRSGPGTDYSKIATLTGGTIVTVTTKNYAAGWHKIDYNGTAAYVSAAYVVMLSGQSAVAEATPSPTKAPTDTAATGVVSSTTLNVRSGPGTGYDKLGTLTRGTSVTVTAKNYAAGWHQINYDGTTGYVSASYVKFSAAATTVVALGTVTAGTVNVRSGAGTTYGILGKFTKGATVTVTNKAPAAGWYQILYNGQTAYVSSSYVKLK